MTGNLPVIGGTYADLRQVKSRGVWQLVVDVPAEDAEKLVDLFGLPRQDEPTWLAIARLKNPPGATDTGAAQGSAAADHPQPPERSASAPGGPKRERTLPEKVGMTCANTRFQDWAFDFAVGQGWSIGEPPADCPGLTREDVGASVVRRYCGVGSRKEILPGTDAAEAWLALETRFLEETNQMAERRS